MSRYERVTYHPVGGRNRSVFLDVKSDQGRLLESGVLVGEEVTIEGETKWVKGGTTSTIHMISTELIIERTPMVMDLHYGILVEVGAHHDPTL